MQYKLVLSDIDGTLLNDENRLLPTTLKTIRDLVKSGVLFATVSARTVSHTMSAISNLREMCCANAYVNGSFVEASNGEVLLDSPIEEEDVSIIVEELNRVQASFCCISKDGAVAKLVHPGASKGFKLHHGTFIERPILDVPELKTYLVAAEANDIQPVIDAATKHRCNIEMSPIVQSPITGLKVSFFQKKGTNKKATLQSIAAYYGVDISGTLAIGDSIINDTPMIEAAGYGVAMKNSHKTLLSKANSITEKDNNEDGVGFFLRSLFGL